MSTDRDDEKLEALLRSRPIEPPSTNLAARITLAALTRPRTEARARPQSRPRSLGERLSDLFADLRLPQPAFALAALLLVGLVAGWSLELDALVTGDDSDAVYVQSFLYPDEEWS